MVPVNGPALVPWSLVWVGLIIAVSGAIISMWTWGQREPTKVESFGKVVIALGIVLLLGTPLANAFGFFAYALNGAAQNIAAAVHPVPEQ